jgi:hypothetical protein
VEGEEQEQEESEPGESTSRAAEWGIVILFFRWKSHGVASGRAHILVDGARMARTGVGNPRPSIRTP